MIKGVSTRAPGSCATCHVTDLNETFPVSKGLPKNPEGQTGLCFFSGVGGR